MKFSEDEAIEIINKFRSPHLWKKTSQGWKRLQELKRFVNNIITKIKDELYIFSTGPLHLINIFEMIKKERINKYKIYIFRAAINM